MDPYQKPPLPLPRTAPAVPSYVCTACGRRFISSLSMDCHQCSAEPWLPCLLCNEAYFRTRLQLQGHLHHECRHRSLELCRNRRRRLDEDSSDSPPHHRPRFQAEPSPPPPPPPPRFSDQSSPSDSSDETMDLHLVESALGGYAKTYQITCTNECDINVDSFLQAALPVIESTLQNELRTVQGVKFNLWLEANYVSPSGELAETPRNFKTTSTTLYQTTPVEDIRNYLIEGMQKLYTEMQEQEARGSGWTLQSIHGLQLRLSKCSFYRTGLHRMNLSHPRWITSVTIFGSFLHRQLKKPKFLKSCSTGKELS